MFAGILSYILTNKYVIGAIFLISLFTGGYIYYLRTSAKIANLEYNNLVLQMNELDAIKLVNNSGFFVVAYIDELSLEKRYEIEDELYDFLGRFYIRENLFRLCGLS